MNVIYHEQLPDSYLLILAPGSGDEPEEALAHWLNCARSSGKPAVWVDCGMLRSLSGEAVRLLWASHHQLAARHAQLVLVHVPDGLRQELLDQEPGSVPCIVPTLLDAAQQVSWKDSYLAY